MDNPKLDGMTVMKTLLEICARERGLRLEYTIDRETNTFTYGLYNAEGRLVQLPV